MNYVSRPAWRVASLRHFSGREKSDLPSLLRSGKLKVHPEVAHALETGRGAPKVVALESAIITHGLPAPTNFETAVGLEQIVRSEGCTPATVAVLDGVIHVGLYRDQLARLSDPCDVCTSKLSRRDLVWAISHNITGGTTCAATTYVSQAIGIDVFATGGLGGVHREGQSSLDISADLIELGRSAIFLVSAGVKSILDVGRTLEFLETQGVNVVTFGDSQDFPAFYTPRSGFKSPWNADSVGEAAELLQSQRLLQSRGGTLLAVPIPEAYAEEGLQLQKFVDQALEEADNAMIQGKRLTPWLLDRVRELSCGRSLRSNIALIRNCASIASQVAAEAGTFSEETRGTLADGSQESKLIMTSTRKPSSVSPVYTDLVIIGASAIDITGKPTSRSLEQLTTTKGTVQLTVGGVARNIAEAAHRSRSYKDLPPVLLISPVASDTFADLLRHHTSKIGMRTDGLLVFSNTKMRTPSCMLTLDKDSTLMNGVADMGMVAEVSEDQIWNGVVQFSPSPRMVVMDGNLSPSTILGLTRRFREIDTPTFFEPASVSKAGDLLSTLATRPEYHTRLPLFTFMSPNDLELLHMWQVATDTGLATTKMWSNFTASHVLQGTSLDFYLEKARDPLCPPPLALLAFSLLPLCENIFVKSGPRGVIVATRFHGTGPLKDEFNNNFDIFSRDGKPLIIPQSDMRGGVAIFHVPVEVVLGPSEVASTSGAGDSLVGVLASGLALDGTIARDLGKLSNLVKQAQLASKASLQSPYAVSPELSLLDFRLTS